MIRWIQIGLALGFCFGITIQGVAGPDFYFQHAKGWHWYQSRRIPQPSQETVLPSSAFVLAHPVIAMHRLRRLANQALDRAILLPTPQHVKAYMVLQNAITERAHAFNAAWQQVLLHDPTLNYTLTHPTSSLGREIYLQHRYHAENAALKQFAEHDGLFFFYRGDCPYCHRFAPILKAFVTQYHIPVVAISMGGGFLPAFPNSRVDHGQAKRLHVVMWPAVFAVNPRHHRIVPVGYGLMSEDTLRARLYALINTHRETGR